MAEIDWKPFKALRDIANQRIFEPWVLAVDLVHDVTHLRISVEGSWNPMPGILADCGPDGHAGLAVGPDRLVIPDCAVGALIGRFGGSSAGYQPASDEDKKPFSIGKYCIAVVPPKTVAPLFITFNVLIRPVQVASLKLTVEGATPTL